MRILKGFESKNCINEISIKMGDANEISMQS